MYDEKTHKIVAMKFKFKYTSLHSENKFEGSLMDVFFTTMDF